MMGQRHGHVSRIANDIHRNTVGESAKYGLTDSVEAPKVVRFDIRAFRRIGCCQSGPLRA